MFLWERRSGPETIKKKVGGFTLLKVIHNIKNQNFYRKKANEKANTLKSIYIILSNLRTGVIKLYTKFLTIRKKIIGIPIKVGKNMN